jgi:hypothetical protein
MAKKKGQTPPRSVRMEARGRPGQIRPTADRARQRRRANLITGAVLAVVIGAAIVAGVMAVNKGGDERSGIQTDNAPWPAELQHLSRRVNDIDLPPFQDQPGVSFHNHVHLDVFINGRRTPVPSDIGRTDTFFASIHSHDDSGVIHLEASTESVFTLGEVFDVWGVRFSSSCVGGYCTKDGYDISLYVNGKKQSGDPRAYELKEHDEIAVIVGKPPAEIPKEFDFSTSPSVPQPTASASASPSASATPSKKPKASPSS